MADVGLGGGVAHEELVGEFGVGQPTATVLGSIVVGVVITLASAVLPARRASFVALFAALSRWHRRGQRSETGPDAVRLGDSRAVTFRTGTMAFAVKAIYDQTSDTVGGRFVDLAAFEATVPRSLDSRVYLDADDTAAVDRATAGFPTATVLTTEAFVTQQKRNLDAVLTLMYALLGLTVQIALLGIANTLALSGSRTAA